MSAPNTPLTPSAERLLAERAASGDNAAVEQLYDAYEKRLYGYCHRICRHPEDAADATQEAFCNVIQRLPGLDTANLNFAAYLFTAARNASMDLIKQRRRSEPTDEVPEDPFAVGDLDSDPERALLTGDQQRAAREANDRLPETQRTALALREVSELSYDEIALTMDMNSNAVAQLISRARMNFHKQLRAGAIVVEPNDEAAVRAITLTSARIDGKINDEDLDWLQAHLAANETSRINAEAMQESATLYRAIGPVAIIATLKAATMAKAADLNLLSGAVGEEPPDESDGPDDTGPSGDGGSGGNARVTNPNEYDEDDQHRSRAGKRRAALVAGAAVLILLIAVGIAGGTGSSEQSTLDQAAEVVEPTTPVGRSEANGEPRSSEKSKSKSEPTPAQRAAAGAVAKQLVDTHAPSNNSSKGKRDNSGEKKSSGDADQEAEVPAPETPAPTTTPPADTPPPPPTTPPPKPPKIPGGPGSICGTPGCLNPPPPVP